jgi:uncharacterized protein YndB with AHSA1/START domain
MMNHSLTATHTLTINAPASKVWQGLTDPAIIKQYLFGTDTKTTWEEGSPITFSGEYNGQTYEDKGKVVQAIPGKRLEYTYWSAFSKLPDEPENHSHLVFELTEKDGATELKLTQTGFANEEGRDHSMKNWEGVMGKMKELVEG